LLNKNQTLTGQAERFGVNGEGILRYEGQVVFVPFALPGERITFRVQKVTKTHAFGKLLDVPDPSPSRVDPPCPYFTRCGGCSVQHMNYDTQLRFKRDAVFDCLSRIGSIRQEVNPVTGMDDPWRYRNKTAMPVANTQDGPAAGYYASRSHRLVPVTSCLIAHPSSDAAAGCVIRWMREKDIAAYDETTNTGLIRHIITRNTGSNEVMATLAVNGQNIPYQKELTDSLRQALPNLASLCVTTQENGDNVILGQDYSVLYGSSTLTERIAGLDFELSPLSFSQVNSEIRDRMYAWVLSEIGAKKIGCLIDLYCGAGTISLLSSNKAERVIGIEVSPQSVIDARRNARRNGIANAEFLHGRAEDILPDLAGSGIRPDAVILDPPRKGVHPAVLSSIGIVSPDNIIYISCQPATQARDAAALFDLGYRITAIQPFDMFPQTSEIENVITFRRIIKEAKDG